MNVSVIVATYGSPEWASRGVQAARSVQGAQEAIVYHETTGTLARIRNAAAAAASGDWLCFLDADDELGGGYLEAMRAEHDRHIARSGSALDPDRNGLPPPLLVPAVSFVGPDGCTEPVIPAWDRSIYDVNCAVIGTLVPRLLFERVGGFGEWSAYEDWELTLRCIASGARLIPVPDAVYCARAEEGREGRNTQAPEMLARTYNEIRARHAGVAPRVWAECKVGSP